RHGGARAARDGFDVFVPRLPQVHVHVHQARGDDFAAHVPHVDPVRGPERSAERGDLAVLHEHVARAVEVPAGVDHPAALEEQRPHHSGAAAQLAASPSSGRPPANRYRTAMRTATPFVTCARMTLCDPSATRESISTPRFMGPGCMMVSSRGARSSRSTVTPKTR